MEDTQPRILNNQLFWHISQLRNWDKNEKARPIAPDKWEQLGDELTLNGVKDAFEIGTDGVVYDGNNRLKKSIQLLANGVTNAQNGQDLSWIPVHVNNPQTESEKWALAFRRNGQFAVWDIDGLNEFSEDFSDDLDLSLVNVLTDPEDTLDDLLADEEEDDSEDSADNTDSSDESEKSEDSENTQQQEPTAKTKKKLKEVTCPECSHVFTV